MEEIGFPKINNAKTKGQSGQTFIQHFVVTELNCLYHPVQLENDFGLDGYIEIVSNQNVTGKLLGIQIKHGNSFCNKDSVGNYRFYGKNKHLNYYLNNKVPIIIAILNDDFSIRKWVLFDLEKTTETDKGWWIEIPDCNNIDLDVKEKWYKIAGQAENYEDLINYNWKIDSFIKKSSINLLVIPKQEVINLEFELVLDHFKKLSKNKEFLQNNHSKIDLVFYGYDDDPRQLNEIQEINNWLNQSLKMRIPWFYFLSKDETASGLILLLFAFCGFKAKITKDETNLFQINNSKIESFLIQNFTILNKFIESNNLSTDLRKTISQSITTKYTSFLDNVQYSS